MFNPQGFPDGQIIWDLTTSVDREHQYLETFEMHRRTFVVIAIADYEEECDPEKLATQMEDMKAMVSSISSWLWGAATNRCSIPAHSTTCV
jgi:hypothetical protein